MKIGLITIHHANSYGGVLQAFATKQVLTSFGDVSVIDYKTPHLERSLSLIRLGDGPRGLLRAAKDVARLLPRARLIRKFRKFISHHLQPKPIDPAMVFDVGVTGSDQIWNPDITDGLDQAYFLASTECLRRISFSSSMGSHRYGEPNSDLVKQYLSGFSHIAVREADSAEYVSSLLEGRRISRTIDPTLMLDRADWSALAVAERRVNWPYLLVYSLKDDQLLRDSIMKVARRLRLRIVAINQNPLSGYPVDVHVRDAGPEEYLRLFMDADYVVTNSFHGTAFAVNFSIPFAAVKPESGANRIRTLLSDVGLKNRYAEDSLHAESTVDEYIDWRSAQLALAAMRSASWNYLEAAFESSRDSR